MTSSTERAEQGWLHAGTVAAPHGLDGSFHVARARPRLLDQDATVYLDGHPRQIVRRAGTDRRPIVRLAGVEDRSAARELQGRELLAVRDQAPALEQDEWWVEDLEGCQVLDGERLVGRVRRVLELPSCEVLEVERAQGDDLLVPLVSDAVGEVDVEARQIQVDLQFLGER